MIGGTIARTRSEPSIANLISIREPTRIRLQAMAAALKCEGYDAVINHLLEHYTSPTIQVVAVDPARRQVVAAPRRLAKEGPLCGVYRMIRGRMVRCRRPKDHLREDDLHRWWNPAGESEAWRDRSTSRL